MISQVLDISGEFYDDDRLGDDVFMEQILAPSLKISKGRVYVISVPTTNESFFMDEFLRCSKGTK